MNNIRNSLNNSRANHSNIDSTRTVTGKQLGRIANRAVSFLFEVIGMESGYYSDDYNSHRYAYPKTNGVLWRQMIKSIEAVTLNEQTGRTKLTHGDVQRMDTSSSLRQYEPMFHKAIKALYLTPDALGQLLLKDNFKPTIAKQIVAHYEVQKSEEISFSDNLKKKPAAKKKATSKVIVRKRSKKTAEDAAVKAYEMSDEKRAEQFAILDEQMEALQAQMKLANEARKALLAGIS